MTLTNGYAVIDLETTGLDCWSDLIIELGVAVVTPGSESTVESVLVKIEPSLSAEIVNLTGITTRLLDNEGIPIDDALAWFVERVGQLPLVGHNIIRFDRGFLLEAARRHRREMAGGPTVIDEVDDLRIPRFIDTAALYKGYKLGLKPGPRESHFDYCHRVLETRVPGLRYNLPAACVDLGIATDDIPRHRAAGDVRLTLRLFQALLKLNPPG
ncbi:MAG: exonuclease domain-containing protein [Dehalococcoidia bacterium]